MSDKSSGFLSSNQVLVLALLLFAGDQLFRNHKSEELQLHVQYDVHDASDQNRVDLYPTDPIGRGIAFEPDTEAQEEINLLAKAAWMRVNPRGGVPGAFVLAALGICLGALFLASDTMEAAEEEKAEEEKKNKAVTVTETRNFSEPTEIKGDAKKKNILSCGSFAGALLICAGAVALAFSMDKHGEVGSTQAQQRIENDTAQEEITVLAESARMRVNPGVGVPGGFMFPALGISICLGVIFLAFDTMVEEEEEEEEVKSEVAAELKTEKKDENENEIKSEALSTPKPKLGQPEITKEKSKSIFFARALALLVVCIGAFLVLNTEAPAQPKEASAASEIEIDFLTQSARMHVNPDSGVPGCFALASLGTCLGALFLAFDTVGAAEEEEMKKKAPDHIKIGRAIKAE